VEAQSSLKLLDYRQVPAPIHPYTAQARRVMPYASCA
jgi:hypothetical protein